MDSSTIKLALALAVILVCCRQGDLQAVAFTSPQNNTTTTQTFYSRISSFDCYYDFDGTTNWIQDLVEEYSSSDLVDVQFRDIGDSWVKTKATSESSSKDFLEMIASLTNHSQGFDIYALSIASKASTATTTTAKAPFLLVSSVHAREYTPPELVRLWIEDLFFRIETKDPNVMALLEHTEIHWIPHLNPDARVLAETSQPYRRKNLNFQWNPDYRNCYIDSFGVDLNRNLPFEWGEANGSDDDACSPISRGSGPASEPETQALVAYAESVFPENQRLQNALLAGGGDYNIVHDPNHKHSGNWKGFDAHTTKGVFVDVHSAGKLYIYPWGMKNAPSPNDAAYRSVMGTLQSITGNEALGPGPNHYGVASGATDDWAYAVLGALSMTWELGTFFHEPCSLFQAEHSKHFQAFDYLSRIAPFPFALGKGPILHSIQGLPSTIVLRLRYDDFLLDDDDNDDDDYFWNATGLGSVRIGTSAVHDLGDSLELSFQASMPKELPSDNNNNKESSSTSASIAAIRVFHGTNPFAGLENLGNLPDSMDILDLQFVEESKTHVGYLSIHQIKKAVRNAWEESTALRQEQLWYFQALDDAGNQGPLTTVRVKMVLTEDGLDTIESSSSSSSTHESLPHAASKSIALDHPIMVPDAQQQFESGVADSVYGSVACILPFVLATIIL